MIYSLLFIASTLLLSHVEAVFDATSNSNVIYYWGQNSASAAENDPANTLWQKPLSHYCDNEDADIIVVSFLHQFGQGRSTAYDLANRSRDCKGLIPGTELLDCSHMETEINYCQSKHKKVILSMGGATPAYGIGSIKEGEDLADELWNTFAGGKNSQYRPFGSASIDGFDLDIENGEKAGYAAFVHKMRKNYETDSSKTYYIAAAPQCPFPDYFVGDVLNEAWFDFVMIQFYNNYCNVVNTAAFNYDEWDTWAKTRSINKNVRLFVGIPGSPSAAGRGYVPYTQLVTTIKPLQLKDTFGGIMVWDASQAYGNTQDVLPDYANGITRLIKGNNPAPAELAPVIIGLSPEGTTVARVEPPSTSIPTVIVTILSTVTSTLVPSSSPSSFLPSTSSSLISSQGPLNVPFLIESEAVSTFVTEPVSSSGTTAISSSLSLNTENNQVSGVTPQNVSWPTEGQSCQVDGITLVCSGVSTFAQCVHGQFRLRVCPTGTMCIASGTEPLFCGFPL